MLKKRCPFAKIVIPKEIQGVCQQRREKVQGSWQLGTPRCPCPTPGPTRSDSPLPRVVGSWGCSRCSTYSWKGRSTAGKGLMRTSQGRVQDAGMRAGPEGGAAHLSGRSRYWQCSGEPCCPQTRPGAFLGRTEPGTSGGWGKDSRARPSTGAKWPGGAPALTELSVRPCRMTGLEKA